MKYIQQEALALLVIILFNISNVSGQGGGGSSFRMNPRLSFYSFEAEGEMIIEVPQRFRSNEIRIIMQSEGTEATELTFKTPDRLIRVPFIIAEGTGNHAVNAVIKTNNAEFRVASGYTRLSYKPNEVKADNLTGGLIVNKRQFFPFGFYCYSPVDPSLAEEEVVRGFNMMSPYQKITGHDLDQRKAYMDRCAQVGMKVNYNLLSVSGGGGVGSRIDGLSDEEKRTRLLDEVRMFRDHPALLGWYISDEPNGYKIPPETLEEIYRTVKENDPWHPVSIVFMAPFISAKNYAGALDIVMADPYPVPDMPVSLVGNVTAQLREEFAGKKPVWIAQQSFGGGEIWKREPTIQEVRSMTWQSIIRGATGIQYFVRQAPNYFPKSASTWSECGRIAMEVAELTPWLLSDEETLPVETQMKEILVSSRRHNDQLLIMLANRKNEPTGVTLRIPAVNNGTARLIFENRSVPVNGGFLTDHIGPLGTQFYLITLNPGRTRYSSSARNLVTDPGFEEVASPGIPSACYARPGGDKGATYFLDTREKTEGNHSVRLITPVENKSVSLRFYPFTVKAGASYVISIWAKSDPEQRSPGNTMPQYVEVITGSFGHARFIPDERWRQFVTFVTIPDDTSRKVKTNLILKMPGQGVAWFDELKVMEDE